MLDVVINWQEHSVTGHTGT